jgi:hypothetical protein
MNQGPPSDTRQTREAAGETLITRSHSLVPEVIHPLTQGFVEPLFCAQETQPCIRQMQLLTFMQVVLMCVGATFKK